MTQEQAQTITVYTDALTKLYLCSTQGATAELFEIITLLEKKLKGAIEGVEA